MDHPSRFFRSFLFVVAFLEGAVVMTVELIGGKMGIPYFGNTLSVWTTSIGVTMASVMAGYFAGGFLSQKKSLSRLLYFQLLAISGLLVVLPFIGQTLFNTTLSWALHNSLLVSYFVTLTPPLLVAGALSPVLIQLAVQRETESGHEAGRIFAISTVGGILSAFILGFVILPAWNYESCFFFLAAFLLLVSAIGYLQQSNILYPLIPIAGIMGIVFLITFQGQNRLASDTEIVEVYEHEGLYGEIRVFDDPQKHTRTLNINGAPQTKINTKSHNSYWSYPYRMVTYSSVFPKGDSVLVAGLAGGSLINALINLNFYVDVVELDPRMVNVAQQYFYLKDEARIHIDDFGHFIRHTDKKYSVIILDLSIGTSLPDYVYIKSTFEQCKSHLKEDGLLFINYVTPDNSKIDRGLTSIGKTLQASQFNVRLLKNIRSMHGFLLLASPAPISFNSTQYRAKGNIIEQLQIPFRKNKFNDTINFHQGQILTWNRPILEVWRQEITHSSQQRIRENYQKILDYGIKNYND